MRTPNVEVAEQHTIAWLLGYLCWIRPGSCCPTVVKSGSLEWQRVYISCEVNSEGGIVRK
jgi:hypothetical protein